MFSKIYLKYSITNAICLGAISIGLFTKSTVFFGTIGLLGLIFFAIYNGTHLASNKYFKNLPCKKTLATFAVILTIIIIQSITYFLYKSTPTTILITFITTSILVLLLTRYSSVQVFKCSSVNHIWTKLNKTDFLAFLILITQTTLLYKIFSKATTIALGSPWLLFGNKFFIIYGIVTFLLLTYLYKTKNKILATILILVHYFITFNIITIIYKLGFGYDPFLHRAAESIIFTDGFVNPKTPFYIGQYVSVNMLAHITNIPLKIIDIYLVPILATTLLPLATFFGIKHGFKLKNNWAYIAAILLPLYPLNTMYATTPHNLANLATLIFILIAPVYFHHKKFWPFLALTALTAAVIHPLTGIFAIWLFLGIILVSQKNLFKKIITYHLSLITYLSISIFLTPLLFLTYLKLQNVQPDSIIVIKDNIQNFISLFQRPYYYINRPEAHWILDLIYAYQPIIPIIFILLSIIGYKKIKKKVNHEVRETPLGDKRFLLFLLFPIIIIINAFFVSTWLTLPNLDNFERLQYAERLRHISIYFLIPLALYGIINIIKNLQSSIFNLQSSHKTKIIYFYFIALAILLTSSWYLTYPQRNPKTHFPGYNVTQADIDAATFIHGNTETSHIVLSNILTAAASIDKYGFKKYYDTQKGQLFHYSIPSGSPLYQTYLKMLYEEQKREYMDEAIELTSVDRAYFVINNYWHKFSEIKEGAKKTADGWQEIDGGAVWVFWYDKK